MRQILNQIKSDIYDFRKKIPMEINTLPRLNFVSKEEEVFETIYN